MHHTCCGACFRRRSCTASLTSPAPMQTGRPSQVSSSSSKAISASRGCTATRIVRSLQLRKYSCPLPPLMLNLPVQIRFMCGPYGTAKTDLSPRACVTRDCGDSCLGNQTLSSWRSRQPQGSEADCRTPFHSRAAPTVRAGAAIGGVEGSRGCLWIRSSSFRCSFSSLHAEC